MARNKGHLYLPYDEQRSIQVEYVHSSRDSAKTTVLMPFAVNDNWRREIVAAMQAKDPGRTTIQISNATSNAIKLSSRRPTASTPSPEPEMVVEPTAADNNRRAQNIVGNYLTQSGMYTDQHRSVLSDDSHVHRPDYSGFVSQVAANGAGAPAQAFAQAQHVEAITTPGPVGDRDVYLNPNNHNVFTLAHEDLHRIEHPSLQAPGSRLTPGTVEGMTEYMTQDASGLDFRTGGVPGQRGFTYRNETEAVRNSISSGQYTSQDVQRTYLRGSQSPTDRIVGAQNSQATGNQGNVTSGQSYVSHGNSVQGYGQPWNPSAATSAFTVSISPGRQAYQDMGSGPAYQPARPARPPSR